MNNTNANLIAPIASVPIACVAILCASAAAPLHADQKATAPAVPAMSRGLSLEQLAHTRGVIFAHAMKDVPGKNLVVVTLGFRPAAVATSSGAPAPCTAHRHPGSVWVYVTKGTVRLGVAGHPVQVVHTGESFYEPMGAIHTVAESASATESASAIAVMIVPDGAPLVIPEKCDKP